ncbi:MAG: 50S ribosomal protein L30 [Methanomethylophilus sp.]|jgi:large subunit ribosomal protein L30
MAYIVIRVLGTVSVPRDIRETMELMGLHRPNHAVIVPETDSYRGMLYKIKDYCTFGKADAETVEALLRERAMVTGDAPLTDEYVKEKTEFATIGDLAKAIAADEYKLKDVEGLKPVIRLHPPVGGFEGNKRSFQNGGALGDRKEKINDLVKRML